MNFIIKLELKTRKGLDILKKFNDLIFQTNNKDKGKDLTKKKKVEERLV
jgi:hypothetical protein